MRPVRSPRHDTDYGATVIEFEPHTPGPHQLIEKEGLWQVISYVEAANAYLIGGLYEQGAWLPLDALVYVDDASGAWRNSQVDGSRWMAMAAVAAPGGRYVAFIADPRGDGFELEVLDALNDKLVRAGTAPSPPPFAREEWGSCSHGGRFQWGDPVDGFVEMDPNIMTFPDEQTLVVSYGKDSCRHRSLKRRLQRWVLPELVARSPGVVVARDE